MVIDQGDDGVRGEIEIVQVAAGFVDDLPERKREGLQMGQQMGIVLIREHREQPVFNWGIRFSR
jgi:hypothetical protein